MSRKEGRREFRKEEKFRDIPAWALDDLVLRMLDDIGFRIRVVYDEKYYSGSSNKPLLVIRRKRMGKDATVLNS